MRAAVWIVAALTLTACRGQVSARAPRHLFDDMDWQPKYRPEATSAFFADGRAMRVPLENTVAQGELHEDLAKFTGHTASGDYSVTLPWPADAAHVQRGQERFAIYCSPCHDRAGSGHGAVVARGFPPPVDLASTRVLGLPDGQLFETVTKGVRNMPSYAAQIPVEDRWAIVLWLRVLQRARHGSLADVPDAERAKLSAEVER